MDGRKWGKHSDKNEEEEDIWRREYCKEGREYREREEVVRGEGDEGNYQRKTKNKKQKQE